MAALVANAGFLPAAPHLDPSTLNDVPAIYQGYHATPRLFPDSLRWWHGSWIQAGIESFRPLSAYLYWFDCWLGERAGPAAWGWLGLGLLWAEMAAAGWLAWRFTRRGLGAAVAATAVATQQHWIVGHPPYWLLWFPVHQELLVAALMLAALAALDTWLQHGARRWLAAWWGLLALACLAKETAYLLPGLAAVLTFTRGRPRDRAGLLNLALAAALVGLLWEYRAAVLVHPRQPTLLPPQVPHKLGLFLANVFTRNFEAGNYALVGLPLVLCGLPPLWRALRRRGSPALGRVAGVAAVLVTYLALAARPVPVFLCQLFDPHGCFGRDLVTMLVLAGCVVLLWAARATLPTLPALSLLILAYVPNIDYIGWHYDVVPWGFRAVLYALLATAATDRARAWRAACRALTTAAGTATLAP